MRLIIVLFIAALGVQGCATGSSGSFDPTSDTNSIFPFYRADGGNIQVVSEIPIEVCTSGPGYIQARLRENQTHCTTLMGGPGGMHSDALALSSATAHQVWIRELDSNRWETITIYRCGQRHRYQNCSAEEFDLTIRSDGRLDCRVRWQQRHRECRPARQYGRYGRRL